jgi:DNA uptake protein ComE-like DNA-binding protein
VKAKAIIAARPFGTVEDLTKVKGIKQATLEKVRPYVTVK